MSTQPIHVASEKTLRALTAAPILMLVLSTVLFIAFRPTMPEYIARHAGSDGVGYSSTLVVLSIMLAAPLIPFCIAWAAAHGYFRHDHWFPIQKSVVVAFAALGYGLLGLALGTMVSSIGLTQDEVSGNVVAAGLLGFLLFFTVGACFYAKFLPRAKAESLVKY